MEVFVYKHQSQIMDYLYAPYILIEDYNQISLTSEEKEKAEDIFNDLKEVKKILHPFKKRIEKYYHNKNHKIYIINLYLNLLNEGKDPKTMEDLFEMVMELSNSILKEVFLYTVFDKKINIESSEDLIQMIEDEIEDEKEKWNIYWSYYHLPKVIEEIVSLYQEILPKYIPYYKTYEREIDDMIDNLDIYELFKDSAFNINQFSNKHVRVFVLSSLNPRIVASIKEDQTNPNIDLFLFSRAHLFMNRSLQDKEELLFMAMKALSDPIRYDVLKLMIQTNLKKKEIAEKLSITPANVSFHIQKLINTNLLSISVDEDFMKYQLNKLLLKNVIQKIQDEFEL